MASPAFESTILVADHDLEARNYFETALLARGYSVRVASDGEETLRHIEEAAVSLVLLDIMTSVKDGVETLHEIRRNRRDLPIILVSSALSSPNIMDVVDRYETGFIEKPVGHKVLVQAVEQALGKAERSSKPAVSPAGPSLAESGVRIAGRNIRMRQIESLIKQIGLSDVPVLLQGETGVGKEVLARQLHEHSSRSKKPFLKLNCAALPSELVESELFGYERGAFTGAVKDRQGKFEMAQGGTILLDEIGDMDVRLQAKLLQVLQDREFQRLGSTETVKLDVRIMSATHRDLRAAIHDGTFREDLFYRLNVVNVQIPPLRERKDELVWLAESLLKKHSPADQPVPALNSRVVAALLSYDWPGNVRELENTMRNFLVFRDPDVLVEELRSLAAASSRTKPVKDEQAASQSADSSIFDKVNETKRQLELDAINKALQSTHWNRKQAAALLDLDYKAFLYKMKKLGFEGKAR